MATELHIGLYEHYKGRRYEVLGECHHSETLERLVVYRALYDHPEFGPNALWVRPFDMFLETVEIDGETLPRFRYLGEKV